MFVRYEPKFYTSVFEVILLGSHMRSNVSIKFNLNIFIIFKDLNMKLINIV